jgi:hypothetical protein
MTMSQISPLAHGSASTDGRSSMWMLIASIAGIVVFGAAVNHVEGAGPLVEISILITVTGLVAAAVVLVAVLLHGRPDIPDHTERESPNGVPNPAAVTAREQSATAPNPTSP